MRKYNITLTKDTAPLILRKLQQMLFKKSYLHMHSIYVGRKEIKGYLKSLGLKMQIIDKPNDSMIHQGDCQIEIDNDPDMQLIRMNWNKDRYAEFEYGSGTIIRYGTKLYITSDKIMYKRKGYTSDCQSMLTTIN